MIARVLAWSARRYRIVMAAALVLAVGGELARRALSRDVIPDLSDPQIVLVADWMGHPATEVAAAVTTVLTSALEDVPGSTAVRGVSMTGMAYIDVVFGMSASLAPGRGAILERVARARTTLPANVRVQVGPEASSTGWVFQYALVDPSHGLPLVDLRRLQNDVLRPALESIPGVAEVASVGGNVQQVLIAVDGDALRARGLAFADVLSTLRPWLPAHPRATLAELEALPLGADAAVRDVAHVGLGHDMPRGLADLGGVLPAVGGIVVARRDADLTSVVENVKRALGRQRGGLPSGVKIVTVYDRLELAGHVEHTLLRALVEEVAVVVLVILLFLLHGRSALVPLATLPLVLLLTFAAMFLLGVPANTMSLAGIGIALGVAVDADVVALEACHRRLETEGTGASGEERRARIVAAAGAFAPAILTALVVTALSFLPVFAFTGETGRLVRPLALTKSLVIASAALVTLTLAPALRDRLLGGRIIPEFDNPLTRWLVKAYRPLVHFALRRPALTLATAGLALLSCLPILSRLGGEFLPPVDEGDLLFMPTTLPGVSAQDAFAQLRVQDRAIAEHEAVATVFGKVGRADTATDPAPLSMIETTIHLRPRSEWPKVDGRTPTLEELIDSLDRATRLPGWSGAWTAPARARMDMMSTGMRTPVGIRVVAADPARLDVLGTALAKLAARVPGARSAVFESQGGETGLEFVIDPSAAARHGVDPVQAQATAALLLTDGQIGELDRDGRPTRVRVALDEFRRGLADQVREATVRGAAGQPVPLALVGHPAPVSRPASIRSERGELVAYVYIDLADRTDVRSFIDRARRELAAGAVTLSPGERIEWTGQYELLAAGERRLAWIIPVVLLSMLGLLYLQFRSLAEAAIVLVSVPFALVGSFWTLFLVGYSLSAPVWVGMLSVVGLAMQTGVVMVVYIDDAFHRRVREGKIQSRDDIVAAHAEGTVQRLRPKIMTVATMVAGLLPLVSADGAGAEIVKRVAAPMLGGLATSAFLTLEVLPVIYTIWRNGQLRRAIRTGVPLADVVGTVPRWAAK